MQQPVFRQARPARTVVPLAVLGLVAVAGVLLWTEYAEASHLAGMTASGAVSGYEAEVTALIDGSGQPYGGALGVNSGDGGSISVSDGFDNGFFATPGSGTGTMGPNGRTFDWSRGFYSGGGWDSYVTAEYEYFHAGSYPVTWSDCCPSKSGAFTLTVPPTFSWTPASPCPNDVVTFTESNQNPAWTAPLAQKGAWDFGGGPQYFTPTYGGTSTTQVFGAPGSYPVSLTIWPAQGNPATTTKTVTVQVCDPDPDFTWSPQPACPNDPVTFTDTSTSTGGTITDHRWDFGDPPGWEAWHARDGPHTHTYANPGAYTVRLEVEDDGGRRSTVTKIVTVDTCAPKAKFSWSPDPVCPGQLVTFNDESTPFGSAALVEHRWDLGDPAGWGSWHTPGDTHTHTYATKGSYTVRLEVKDSNGYTDATTRTLVVEPCPPIVDFTWEPAPSCPGEEVVFTDISTARGVATLEDHRWDFADPPGWDAWHAWHTTDTHTFEYPGTYPVGLEVSDSNDEVGDKTHVVSVEYPDLSLAPALTYDYQWHDPTPYLPTGPYQTYYHVSWALPAGVREVCVDHYELQRRVVDRPGSYTGPWVVAADPVPDQDGDGELGDELSYDDGVVPCQEYEWRVRMHYVPDNSVPSAWSNLDWDGYRYVPDAPYVDVQGVVGTTPPAPPLYTDAEVTWSIPADNGCPVQQYEVERRYVSNPVVDEVTTLPGNWEHVAFEDSWEDRLVLDDHTLSLPCDVWEYRVRGENDLGWGPWSAPTRYQHDPLTEGSPECRPCEVVQRELMNAYDRDRPLHSPFCFRTTTEQTTSGLAAPGTDKLGTVNDMAVDPDGYVYVVGDEAAGPGNPNGDFPIHDTAPFTQPSGAYMAVFDPSGSRVVFATYLPGDTATELELIPGVMPGESPQVIVAGTVETATPCATGCPPPVEPACSDGLDNDGDGRMDYPHDAECTSPTDDHEQMNGAYPEANQDDLYLVRFTPGVSQDHLGTYYGADSKEWGLRMAYDGITDTVALGALTDDDILPSNTLGNAPADPTPGTDGGTDPGNLDGGELEPRPLGLKDADTVFLVTFTGGLDTHAAGPTYFDDDLQGAYSVNDDAGYRCKFRSNEQVGGIAFVPSPPGSPEPTQIAFADSFIQHSLCWYLQSTVGAQTWWYMDEYWEDWERSCIDVYNHVWPCDASPKNDPWNDGMVPKCPTGTTFMNPGYKYTSGSKKGQLTEVVKCFKDHPCWIPTANGGVLFEAHKCGWYKPVTMVHHLPLDLRADLHTYWFRETTTEEMVADEDGNLHLTGLGWIEPDYGIQNNVADPMYTTPDAYPDAAGRKAFYTQLAHPWGPRGNGGGLQGPTGGFFTDFDGGSYQWGPQPPGLSSPSVIYSTYFGSDGGLGKDIHVSDGGFVSLTGKAQAVDTNLDLGISTHLDSGNGFIAVWGPDQGTAATWAPRYSTNLRGDGGTAVFRVDALGGVHAAGETGPVQGGDTTIVIGGGSGPAGGGHPVSPFAWSGGTPCLDTSMLCAPGPSYVYWLGGIEMPCDPIDGTVDCWMGFLCNSVPGPDCDPPCNPLTPRDCEAYLCDDVAPWACEDPCIPSAANDYCEVWVCDIVGPAHPCIPDGCDPLADILGCLDMVCGLLPPTVSCPTSSTMCSLSTPPTVLETYDCLQQVCENTGLLSKCLSGTPTCNINGDFPGVGGFTVDHADWCANGGVPSACIRVWVDPLATAFTYCIP